MKCRVTNKKTSVKVGITEEKIFSILLDKYDAKVAEGEVVPFDDFCRSIALESKTKAKSQKNLMKRGVSKVTESAIYKALNIYENHASEVRPSFYEWCMVRYKRREE